MSPLVSTKRRLSGNWVASAPVHCPNHSAIATIRHAYPGLPYFVILFCIARSLDGWGFTSAFTKRWKRSASFGDGFSTLSDETFIRSSDPNRNVILVVLFRTDRLNSPKIATFKGLYFTVWCVVQDSNWHSCHHQPTTTAPQPTAPSSPTPPEY